MAKGTLFIKTTAFTLALMCTSVSMAVADVLNIKSDAPTTYLVKKGDTLWDISNVFLDQPWLWPELWRNNVQIENPHLIYPGDTLTLRYENGQPVIEVVRDPEIVSSPGPSRNKNTIVLTPQSRVVSKTLPISTLPWSSISPFIANHSLIEAKQYKSLPIVLGDNEGTPRFTENDYVMTHQLPSADATYQIVRKERQVIDSDGNKLGLQVSHLGKAVVTESLPDERQIMRLTKTQIEVKQGDRIKPLTKTDNSDLTLTPANTQIGELVQNINGNSLISKHDIVIVNLGQQQVSPGTIFGVYQRGPDVIKSDNPKYAGDESVLDLVEFNERIKQPGFKVGELVIVKTFENASYAWVTKTTTYLRGGETVAKP